MNKFNLRVYGLLINEKQEILLSSELRYGKSMMKFPGGGLEYGEGLADGLKREFQEECGVDVQVGELFYVNDFLQESAFRSNEQLISFYYWIECPNRTEIETVAFDYQHTEEGEKSIWRSLKLLTSDDITFPIDKIVLNRLKAEF